MTLYHRAADMLERYGRVDGVMHCEVSMLIAELRAAAALDELVRENERLGLYDDPKPVAWRCRDYVTGCWFISDKPDPAGSIAGGSVPLYAAPAPAQPVDDGKLWSFLRSVMAQGIGIRADHTEYELFSARLDAAAAERVEQLRAITGDKP